MVAATAQTEWMMQHIGELSNSHHEMELAARRVKGWSDGMPQPVCKESLLLAQEKTEDTLQQNLAITDAKSLHGSLRKDARGKEPRVALAVAEIRQSLEACLAAPRWIPHNFMLCDGLTKQISKSNLLPLLVAMRTGNFKIAAEGDEESDGQKIKEKGLSIQRLKGRVLDLRRGPSI